MVLRKQIKGSQKPWKEEDLKDGLEAFYKEYQRYPTSHEFDDFPYLPSSRQIQRRFGGLVELRKALGLNGPTDFTKGSYSSKRASSINKRSHKLEKEVYEYLINKFGVEFVHREYLFTDDGRSRTDFFVYDTGGSFSVDVFYPASIRNLSGCLNSKLNKYKEDVMLQYPVIFLQMNGDITQEELDKLLSSKKKRLKKHQYLMGWEMFRVFCGQRKPLLLPKQKGGLGAK